MKTLIVWYFLVGGGGSNIAVAGPFQTEKQCEILANWAFKYKYTSPCYDAPLAVVIAGVEDCHAKIGCE